MPDRGIDLRRATWSSGAPRRNEETAHAPEFLECASVDALWRHLGRHRRPVPLTWAHARCLEVKQDCSRRSAQEVASWPRIAVQGTPDTTFLSGCTELGRQVNEHPAFMRSEARSARRVGEELSRACQLVGECGETPWIASQRAMNRIEHSSGHASSHCAFGVTIDVGQQQDRKIT